MVEQNELSKAFKVLNEMISKDSSDLQSILLRGHINYKIQHWGDAMNDYASVLELDPDNQEAKSRLEMAGNILGYFTPDLFNP